VIDLPDDVVALAEVVRQFGATEVAPAAGDWDGRAQLPASVLGRVAELGLLGATVAEAQGGAGTSWLGAAVIVETLARSSGSLAAVVAAHEALCVAPVGACGNDEQQAAWLPELLGGALGTGTFAPGITAARAAGGWRLAGRATDVIGGATAQRIVVLAQTEGGPSDEPTAFLVPADAPGLRRSPLDVLGLRAAGLADLELDGVVVPDDRRLGVAAGASRARGRAQDRLCTLLAAIAVGLGRGALAAAVTYAKERQQFGQPIASFQAIQWKIADAATGLDAAALLVHAAARRLDDDRPATSAAARALAFAGTQACAATNDALQIHGGYGYVRDFPVERMLRDARSCQVIAGPPAVLRARVADAIAQRFA